MRFTVRRPTDNDDVPSTSSLVHATAGTEDNSPSGPGSSKLPRTSSGSTDNLLLGAKSVEDHRQLQADAAAAAGENIERRRPTQEDDDDDLSEQV